MIVVTQTFTSDDTDALSGTDLENAPSAGVYAIWAASTQQDTLMEVSTQGVIPAKTVTLPKRTDGEPNMQDDMPVVVAVRSGTKVTISIDIVTGATVTLKTMFTPSGAPRR